MLTSRKKDILLVESDAILGGFLHKYLQKNNYHSIFKRSGSDIPDVTGGKHFDIVILDANVVGKNGLYWLRWLKTYYPNVPVIFTSTDISKDEHLLGLAYGAHDHLIKPFYETELLTRLENILRMTPPHNYSPKYTFEAY